MMHTSTIVLSLAFALGVTQQPEKKPEKGVTVTEVEEVPAAVRQAAERALAEKRAALPGQSPAESTPPPPRPPLPEIKDADVAAAFSALNGTFISTMQGNGTVPEGVPPLTLNLARVDITGLDNAAYLEVARGDSPYSPFRQGIVHVYKKDGALRLRMFDFAGPNQGLAVVGMWLAPEAFPPLAVGALVVNADLALTKEGETYTAQTERRMPTTGNGAWEFESALTFGKDGLTLNDKGFDINGKQIFGQGTPGSQRGPLVFKPFSSPAKVQKTATGLIILDLAPLKDGTPLSTGMSGVVNFSGYLLDGVLVGTTRQEGGKPQPFTLPGRMIAGWNEGMPGMTPGSKRRLIVPPGLGFGDSGSRDGRVPPKSTLAFEIELVHADDAPANPSPVAPPSNPTGPGANPAANGK